MYGLKWFVMGMVLFGKYFESQRCMSSGEVKGLKKLVGISLQEIQPDSTTISQLLTKTAGVDRETVITLDALRRQRNVVDYSGDLVPHSAVKECVSQADYLIKQVRYWISTHHPELIPD